MSTPGNRQSRFEPPGADDTSIREVHGALLREKPEPSEERAPVPLLLLALVCALVFTCGIYFGRYSGPFDLRKGFDPLVYDEEAQGGGGAGAAAVAVDPVVLGKRLFSQNCVSCHQTTGAGLPGVYPPLVGSEWVQGSEERLVRILLHGLGGAITVKGATYNGAMPSFGPLGSGWRDDRIAAVATFIRQEWGNKAAPVTAEQVARIRAATADRKTAWKPEELTAFGSSE